MSGSHVVLDFWRGGGCEGHDGHVGVVTAKSADPVVVGPAEGTNVSCRSVRCRSSLECLPKVVSPCGRKRTQSASASRRTPSDQLTFTDAMRLVDYQPVELVVFVNDCEPHLERRRGQALGRDCSEQPVASQHGSAEQAREKVGQTVKQPVEGVSRFHVSQDLVGKKGVEVSQRAIPKPVASRGVPLSAPPDSSCSTASPQAPSSFAAP